MQDIPILPSFVDIGSISISQTLFTSLSGTILFIVFCMLYFFTKKNNSDNNFVHGVDLILENMIEFFDKASEYKLGKNIIIFITFILVYVVWQNLRGVLGDLLVLIQDEHTQHILHSFFRPANTDILFNLSLAIAGVFGAVIYGFVHHGISNILKYIPYKGMGIVHEVNSIGSFVAKIFDLIIGFFLGFLEILSEFSRSVSLSLRLFGNILAGMVLVGLIISAINAIQSGLVPYIGTASWLVKTIASVLQLSVMFFETGVSILQGFVFAILVMVFFKIAHDGHGEH